MERELSYETKAGIKNLKKHEIYPPPPTFICGSFINVEEHQQMMKKAGEELQKRATNKTKSTLKRRKANRVARASRKQNR